VVSKSRVAHAQSLENTGKSTQNKISRKGGFREIPKRPFFVAQKEKIEYFAENEVQVR